MMISREKNNTTHTEVMLKCKQIADEKTHHGLLDAIVDGTLIAS